MKTVRHFKDEILHVEVPGCIVNIRPLLIDMNGRSVTSVEIIVDRCPNDDGSEWKLDGTANNRIIRYPAQRGGEGLK